VVDLVKSLMGIEKQLLDLVFDFVPEDVKTHLRASQKERLLAVRALLDARIKRLEESGTKARKRPQKVKVE